jgi:K+-transporting ATPase ATPase C chain
MNENLRIAIRITLLTTILFGLVYPLAVTGLSQLIFPGQANGSLITSKDGHLIGSHLLGQPFSSDKYFHSRPSSAGKGYDAQGSSPSNLGPTNHALLDRVNGDVQKLAAENPGASVPIDLVTASGSGLDPDISPAAAAFQVARVARIRGMNIDRVRALVAKHTLQRQFGILGEPRVNVLELNLDLDAQ